MAAGVHSPQTIQNVITRLEIALERCKVLQKEMESANLTEIKIEGQKELERALFNVNKWPETGVMAVRLAMIDSLDIGDRATPAASRTTNAKKL